MTDLRAPALGLVAWLAALAAFLAPRAVLALGFAASLGWLVARRRSGVDARTGTAWLVAAAGVAVCTVLRIDAVTTSPVALLADEGAAVDARLVITSDPRLRQGRFGTYVVVRARAEQVVGRGARHRLRVPILVLGDGGWSQVRLGENVRAAGRLRAARTDDLAAVLHTRGPPRTLGEPGPLLDGAERLRASVRAAVAGHPRAPAALVPALVDGDDGGLPEPVAEDFRTAGLTHLLAVSGTNLTLVVGCVLIVARWTGVRARGLLVVGLLGVAGFVLLARTEPSVVRAAAMGSVALLAMSSNGRQRGGRALGVAVLGLLLLDPWLARSVGFALSVAATAGILWLAPAWRDRLMRWLPRWMAEALSVPLAAQLSVTPIVAAISGQVSLVAVLANLVVAPAVGPATVLGLAGGVAGLAWDRAGSVVAAPAAWCARWIIMVAERGAELPTAAVAWPSGPWAIAALTVLCIATALVLGSLLSRRALALSTGGLLVVVLLVPMPTPGWPPDGWVMVACDVGQGDALVINAGSGTAVVVDAGPEPEPVDRCLTRLGVTRVPVVVLTHFHADHVDGLEGVVRDRRVGVVEVTTLADPLSGVRRVEAVAAAAHVPLRRARYGETRTLGQLTWQVIGPSRLTPSDSPANDASVVLLAQSRGVRILLLGDQEEASQAQLHRETGGVRADVLKVAHHGSAAQDPDLVRSTGAALALISVGADNDYGHPAPSLLALLRGARMRVLRTDRDGDLAVTVRHGALGVRARGVRR